MSSMKKLRAGALKFRKGNPAMHNACINLIYYMSNFIKSTCATEVTVGYKKGKYYQHVN